MDPREEKRRSLLVEELTDVEVDKPNKKVKSKTKFTSDTKRASITALLHEFKEVFVWHPSDIPDINMKVISQEFKIEPMIKFQKRRTLGKNNRLALRGKVGKPLDTSFIKEINFHT